jgi:hypothetical protein
MEWENIWASVIGTVVGGFISLLVTRHYALQASKELLDETALLRQQNAIVLDALEGSGMANLTRDKDGRVIGVQFKSYHAAARTEGQIILLSNQTEPSK